MNALDIIVLAVVLLSGLFAFARGFVREALSIASWVGAIAAAVYAAPMLQPMLARYLPKGAVADAVAEGVVFFVALIALSIITSAIARQVRQTSLSALDRTVGLIFGLARGVLLVCLGYIALSFVLPPSGDRPHWITESRTLPLVANAADGLIRLMPPQLRRQAAQFNPQERIETEVESAIKAYSLPGPKPSAAGAPPTYAPDDQQRLDQLFQRIEGPRSSTNGQ